MTRHYYARECAYGTRTWDEYDRLHVFLSKADRDAWVDADRWDGSNYHRQEITRYFAKQLQGERVFHGNFNGTDISF